MYGVGRNVWGRATEAGGREKRQPGKLRRTADEDGETGGEPEAHPAPCGTWNTNKIMVKQDAVCFLLLLPLLSTSTVVHQDAHEHCQGWARKHECTKNIGWMLTHCPHSCGNQHLEDTHDLCRAWADDGECSNNPKFMLLECPESCGYSFRWDPFSKQRLGADPSLSKRGRHRTHDLGVQHDSSGQEGGSGDGQDSCQNGFDFFMDTLQSRNLGNDHFEAFVEAQGVTLDRLARLLTGKPLRESSTSGVLAQTNRRGADSYGSLNVYTDMIHHWSMRETGAITGIAESFLYALRNGIVALDFLGDDVKKERDLHIQQGLDLDHLIEAHLLGGNIDWLRRNFAAMLMPLRGVHALLETGRHAPRRLRPLHFARASATNSAPNAPVSFNRAYALSHWRLPPFHTTTTKSDPDSQPAVATTALMNSGRHPMPLLGFGTWQVRRTRAWTRSRPVHGGGVMSFRR